MYCFARFFLFFLSAENTIKIVQLLLHYTAVYLPHCTIHTRIHDNMLKWLFHCSRLPGTRLVQHAPFHQRICRTHICSSTHPASRSNQHLRGSDVPVPLGDVLAGNVRATPSAPPRRRIPSPPDQAPHHTAHSPPTPPPAALSWLEEDEASQAIAKTKHAALRALKRRTMHSGMLREKLLAKGHTPGNIDAALAVRVG